MRVAVVCEESAEVREAFRRRGHDAVSFDLGFSRRPGPHVRGDVRKTLDPSRFDIFICFPTCTYLCNSGVWCLSRDKGRRAKMESACEFFRWCWKLGPVVAIENPVMHGHAKKLIGIEPTQVVHPWQFGHNESKATCLWLKGLPRLSPTNVIGRDYLCGCGHRFPNSLGKYGCPNCNGERAARLLPRANQTASGQNKYGPSPLRARQRSKTFRGIAEAMADQWGSLDVRQLTEAAADNSGDAKP